MSTWPLLRDSSRLQFTEGQLKEVMMGGQDVLDGSFWDNDIEAMNPILWPDNAHLKSSIKPRQIANEIAHGRMAQGRERELQG